MAFVTLGFTNNDARHQYQQFDVKDLLQIGTTSIYMTVGEGWCSGKFSRLMKPNTYVIMPGCYSNWISPTMGTTTTIPSDRNWYVATSPIRYSGIYEGELYDARIQPSACCWKRYEVVGRKNIFFISRELD